MTIKVPVIEVLDIPIFNGSIQDAYNILMDEIEYGIKNSYCISATGAHGLVTTKKDKTFKKILKQFFINLPDGMPGVWIGKLKGAKRIKRCYGPEFFEYILRATSDKNIRHFFCGGKEGVASILKKVCSDRFGNEHISGCYCPPFRQMTNEEMLALASEINQKNVDIVWVGISTPKQEIFAYKLSKLVNVHFIITVGAAFDFHIGKVRQAPKIIQKSGLEWLFRLCIEPKRLGKRYLNVVPLFVYYNISNLLKLNKRKL